MDNCPICNAAPLPMDKQPSWGTHCGDTAYECGSRVTYCIGFDEPADIVDNCSPTVDPFPKKDKWVFFRKKRVELGDGHITAYTLFESKKHFGIILYNWKTIRQNRFHSHAFPAYAYLLNGSYTEEVIEDGKIVQKEVNNRFKRRFIPRNYIHRILKAAPNTWTIVFTGKWSHYWYEYFGITRTWIKYTWGRKKVREYRGGEDFDIINRK